MHCEGLATCLNVTSRAGVRCHVHIMAGARRAAYIMVRVTSGAIQSEWMIPNTIEL